jgi:hypothetical protein
MKLSRIQLSLFLATFFLLTKPQVTYAQDPPDTQEAVVTHNVRLRSDPSTNHKPLATLPPGT